MAPIEWTSALLVADRDQNKAQWARMMRNRKVPHIFQTSDELAALLAGLLRSARNGKHVVLAGQGTAASMKAALPAATALTGSDGMRFSMHAVNADRARSIDLVNGGAPLSPTVPLCDTHGTVVTSGAELQLAAGGLDAAKAAHGASGFNVLAMIALDGDGSRLGSLVMIESKKPMPQLMLALGAKAQMIGTDAVALRTLLKNIPITLGILIAGVSAAGDKKSLERLECLAALDAPRMGSRDAQLLIGKKLRMPLQQCASTAERQREHQAAVMLQRAEYARAETVRREKERAAKEWLVKAAEALDQGDLDRAARMCDKASAKLPGLPGLLSLRAAIHEAVNRPSPEVASLLSSARAALLSGDVARAREEVVRAAQLQPSCSLVQAELALMDATPPEALHVINNKAWPHIAIGIDRTAPPPMVRKAYKKLALKLHPDKGDHPILETAFKALHAAYMKITHSPAYQAQL